MASGKNGWYVVEVFGVTISGQKTDDFNALVAASGTFSGFLTFMGERGRSRKTIQVEFKPNGKSAVPFETIESNPRSGVLRKLPLGFLMFSLSADK